MVRSWSSLCVCVGFMTGCLLCLQVSRVLQLSSQQRVSPHADDMSSPTVWKEEYIGFRKAGSMPVMQSSSSSNATTSITITRNNHGAKFDNASPTVTESPSQKNVDNYLTYIYQPSCGEGESVGEGEMLFGSKKLVSTLNPDRHDVVWLVKCAKNVNVTQLVKESVEKRLHAVGFDTSNIMLTSAERNAIFANWMIIIHDTVDWGSFGILKNVAAGLRPLVGYERLYIITRTTFEKRNFARMPAYHSWNHTIPLRLLGKPHDFSGWIRDKLVFGIKHFHFMVRDDTFRAINRALAEMTTNDTRNSGPGTFIPNAVRIPRPRDVAHFWDPNNSREAHMRASVSTAILKLNDPPHNRSAFANIVGWRARKGRTGVHPDYVKGLLEHKIVVVCQRDRYQDHIRLFEAFISGAMVMSDYMVDFPSGVVENKTVVVYYGLGDLQNKVLYYLDHEQERLQIAHAGRINALMRHRVWHRYEDLILGNWSNRDKYGVSILNPG